MRLVRFRGRDGIHVGVVEADTVADVSAATPDLPHDLPALLAGGGLATVAGAVGRAPRLGLGEVTLEAPVGRPPKFLAIGLNYAAHLVESLTTKPDHQLWFNKQSTCVIGPGTPIQIPQASSIVDYEGELAMVIGRRCRHVPRGRAHEVIAGYLVCNDVSVRDWQRRTPTMTMGKSFDTHGPLGPWLVTADEVGEPHGLRLRTWVNGELRQDAHTDEMLFNCWEMIEHLSTAFTLEPGDVISTGTPAGVGSAMHPPRLLAHGDLVEIEIERIGRLRNPVINEPSDTACGLD